MAIFEPVQLEGTTVSRASLHNISVMEELELGIGDEITVYKANMIIPQVAENKTRSGHVPIPESCPACGGETKVEDENGIRTLVCTNEFCSARKIKSFSHFVSRDAMNVEGLSEATLEKMIERGYLKELDDLFDLKQYKEEITAMDGFGEKSCENLLHAIDAAREPALANFIYSLGIANVGLSNAKLICRHFHNNLDAIRKASVEDFTVIDQIGPMIGEAVVSYFRTPHNTEVLEKLLEQIHFKQEEENQEEQILEGKTIVITGSLNRFGNRKELKERIEQLGGKVTGSVSKKTDYLINNNKESSSSKNKKAKELGIPIISEDDFLEMMQ